MQWFFFLAHFLSTFSFDDGFLIFCKKDVFLLRCIFEIIWFLIQEGIWRNIIHYRQRRQDYLFNYNFFAQLLMPKNVLLFLLMEKARWRPTCATQAPINVTAHIWKASWSCPLRWLCWNLGCNGPFVTLALTLRQQLLWLRFVYNNNCILTGVGIVMRICSTYEYCYCRFLQQKVVVYIVGSCCPWYHAIFLFHM